MLHFLLMSDNRGPLRRYYRSWGQPLYGRVRLISYDDVGDVDSLPDGTFVFGDGDRLSDAGLAAARRIWDGLAARGDRVRLLNKPGLVLGRRQLLRRLYDAGINRFNVHDLDDPRDAVRYPVFVRSAREHAGAYTPLLDDAEALRHAVDELIAAGRDRSDLLIVEFLDTSVDGWFGKHGAAKIGDRLIAQHIMYQREWAVKGPTVVTPDFLAAEDRYRETNPHRAELIEAFRLANIEYGRVDYGLFEGRVQIWEINTNPHLLYPRKVYQRAQLPAKYATRRLLNEALAAIDDRPTGRTPLRERLRSYRDLWR